MQQDVELKQVRVEDVALLRTVAMQAYSDHYADTWYDGGAWYMQNYFSTGRLQEELRDRDARFFFVNYKGVTVGFVKINNKPLTGSTEGSIELERIYLTKNASGKGIGTSVLQWIVDLARSENNKCVWLKVMDTSPGAVRFYEKAGFVRFGTHQVDFPQKKEGMRGMFIMQKIL